MDNIRCLADTADELGESPVWDPRDNCVWWLDNLKPAIHRCDPATGAHAEWKLPEFVGSIGLRAKGGFIAGTLQGFAILDPAKGIFDTIARPEPDRPGNRMNDGKVDRRGRYWCGGMNARFVETYEASASLWRLDPDGSVHRMETGIIVGNGIAFSPDDRTMYLSDSSAKTVWAYDFDLDAGTIANRRVFLSATNFPGHNGKVDGAAVDTDGFYWAALPYDGLLIRYAPDGRVDRCYRMPSSCPTMPSFGGAGHDVMFVTTARKFLNGWQRGVQRWEGALLEITGLGVKALPEPMFAG
ncbi:SMP-30/gluconolactonase/LRE family protein [Falsiroseomonas sp.]|uniref:SMP-30/gluconolactonase/LRE family protein n=1 Tax=Falsiroseomonas sp. TaxID=2870721 RepID=UPI003F6F2BE5